MKNSRLIHYNARAYPKEQLSDARELGVREDSRAERQRMIAAGAIRPRCSVGYARA
ncbi:MAG: hypothetical protein HYW65_04220 [Candidatus Liptonbacteria bacterium]|nr:hypothetical protein [Candidatus Liptonbacteria bacterium]